MLSFGTEKEYKRAIFSILSFWSWFDEKKSGVRFIIYTDNTEYFKPFLLGLDIIYKNISSKEIQESNAITGYKYRFKISVVEKTFALYPDDDLIFIDTDTFFFTNPQQLLSALVPGQSLMHLREYTFEDAIDIYKWENTSTLDGQQFPRSFVQLIESKSFLIGDKNVDFNRHQYIWNSGVLGLTKEMAAYIPNVYALTDEFYAKTKWRISEQLAFGLVLNSVSKLLETGDYISHYWHYKDRIDLRLNEVLTIDFEKSSLKNKLSAVRKKTLKFCKLIHHEQMMTNTKNYMREKDYKNGLKYAVKAFIGLPLNDDLIKIIKYRLSQVKS